ncbi:MAG: alpha/beta fold hydrolase [Bryobacteraceae bacterium]
MLTPFRPLLRNAHLLTIFGNFARRRLDVVRFPVEEKLYRTEPDVQVMVHSQHPAGQAKGEILMIHGLEGSSAAGYMISMCQLALESGYAVHRTNLRSCGGTEALCRTMYHAGLTSDTLQLIRQIRTDLPVYVIGYSLGGNVTLKLAGELGEGAAGVIDGVCAVSTIDLAASVRKMSRRGNFIYQWRFLSRLKQRIRKRARSMPGVYDLEALEKVTSVYEFDDKITAPFFGFETADNYYATQSSNQFLHRIRVPTLIIQAIDDPLIPFEIFDHPGLSNNANIRLLAVDHGGHLGFLAAQEPRFWVDRAILHWLSQIRNSQAGLNVLTS